MKDIILAWLNGAEVEKLHTSSGVWKLLPSYHPYESVYFSSAITYRIKPKEPDFVMLYLDTAYPERQDQSGILTSVCIHKGINSVIEAHTKWLKETGALK